MSNCGSGSPCYAARMLFLSHISALEGLRALAEGPLRPVGGFAASEPSPAETRAAERLLPFSRRPVHILVPSAVRRTRCSGWVCHVVPRNAPPPRFFRLCAGVGTSSPEWCFAQLASTVSCARLAQIGCELCGSYRIVDGGRGFIGARPLVSAAALERFVAGLEGVAGVKRARRALRFVADGSASPMETVVLLLVCLPPRMGGYGLPAPIMNGLVNVPASHRRVVSKSRYYCDLLWPEARLALEYESDERHTGSFRIFRDSSRRADLAHLGIETVTLTRLQVFNKREFEKVIALLERRLGVKRRPSGRDWATERIALRNELLDFARERT